MLQAGGSRSSGGGCFGLGISGVAVNAAHIRPSPKPDCCTLAGGTSMLLFVASMVCLLVWKCWFADAWTGANGSTGPATPRRAPHMQKPKK